MVIDNENSIDEMSSNSGQLYILFNTNTFEKIINLFSALMDK